MNWEDARLFLAVARSRQLLGASKKLGLNHATLSRRMTQLENDLKAKLLIRRTSGCDLTAEGERFLVAAERAESEMILMQASISGIDAAISGTVRLGAPDGFGVAFLAPRLGQLTAQYPALRIQLVPVPRTFSLSHREADIAITIERPQQGRLISSKLTDYSLGLYASRYYLAEEGAPETVDDLRRHRRVGYVEDLIFTTSLNFTSEIMPDWDASFEISSAIGQTEAVRAGAGIGILHNYVARQSPELVRILPSIEIRRSYWTTYHESTRDLTRIKTVVAFLQRIVAEQHSVFI